MSYPDINHKLHEIINISLRRDLFSEGGTNSLILDKLQDIEHDLRAEILSQFSGINDIPDPIFRSTPYNNPSPKEIL